jgi:DNA-binding NarL/FixJ family response regulator
MLTSYSDDEAVLASIVAGASGYVLKETRGRELVKAIETVGEGGSLLDLAVAKKVIEKLRTEVDRRPIDKPDALSGREARILDLLAEGKTNREIAQEVFLSEKTVKNYVSAILGKLNLSRRSQVAAYVARSREAVTR